MNNASLTPSNPRAAAPFEPAERRWFPAPDFFIAADFDDAPVVDRSPRLLVDVLAQYQGDIVLEHRMLDRERRRPQPSNAVIQSVKARIEGYEMQRERLLMALLWHQSTWAHLAADCLVCDRSVSL